MEVFPHDGRTWKRFSDGASAGRRGAERDGPTDGMSPGDAVRFARLDLAETLGIWRNATGRVVGIHPADGAADTVDVEFEGHEILQAYLPAMFRRVN
ncbi:hypothetical protein SAMN04488125_11433 [Methylorubrum salsuginis]|uniref:Uncharacterized protein n=2 Tax=Hyphomicrobiales TaxID=356 RepID=A0A1I4HAX0_9HYPH|nr:hypothetical protein SAMN04488125_11433 [Methylorubrum salsuginis]